MKILRILASLALGIFLIAATTYQFTYSGAQIKAFYDWLNTVTATISTTEALLLDGHTALQEEPSEGAFVDGDKTKLAGIEASADVTDAANVAAAGAVMLTGNGQIAGTSANTPIVADYIWIEDATTGLLGRTTLEIALALAGVSGGWETSLSDLGYVATPTVVKNTIYICSTNFDGESELEITNFVYSGSSPVNGDKIGVVMDADEAKIKFNDNSDIEGNSNVPFNGDDSQHVLIIFTFVDDGVSDRWQANLTGGWLNPTTLAASSIATASLIIPSAVPITLTSSQMNSIVVMTGAGDVDILADMCDTATGQSLTVKSTAAHLNSITSNDAADQFVLSNGTALDAQDELDLAGAAGSQAKVVCIQANKWWVMEEIGTCSDGGTAD
jgi:hypothetical protein